jgi:hypothetical protein
MSHFQSLSDCFQLLDDTFFIVVFLETFQVFAFGCFQFNFGFVPNQKKIGNTEVGRKTHTDLILRYFFFEWLGPTSFLNHHTSGQNLERRKPLVLEWKNGVRT